MGDRVKVVCVGVNGERKKTKSSTQFLAGLMLCDCSMAIIASAIRPKAKPALAAPKGATWSM